MLEMIKQINISINRKILLKGNLYFYCVATFCPIYIVRHYILLYYTPEENFVLVLSVWLIRPPYKTAGVDNASHVWIMPAQTEWVMDDDINSCERPAA